MDAQSLLEDAGAAGDSGLPCDVGTDLVFPVTFTSPTSYLVTTFRLYSTFCIAFMVSRPGVGGMWKLSHETLKHQWRS